TRLSGLHAIGERLFLQMVSMGLEVEMPQCYSFLMIHTVLTSVFLLVHCKLYPQECIVIYSSTYIVLTGSMSTSHPGVSIALSNGCKSGPRAIICQRYFPRIRSMTAGAGPTISVCCKPSRSMHVSNVSRSSSASF